MNQAPQTTAAKEEDMKADGALARIVSCVLLVTMISLISPATMAQATMISTGTAVQQKALDQERTRVRLFLERDDVQKSLQAHGISPLEAKARVDSLTDREVTRIADKLDMLPAGGSGLGVIVGAAVFVFIVLLITDILGFTDVFSFVNS